MAHSHHKHCNHDVKWCHDCRAVYCTRCPETFRTNAEWLRDHKCHDGWYFRSYYNTQTPLVWFNTATTGNTPLDVTPTVTCSHGGQPDA